MDIVILLLITLLLYLLPQNKEYLNVKSTSGLRGFLALGIIFHHISPLVKTGEEFSNFSYMGTYIVSIFFFLSAYGLYVQNESRENYLDNFLVKRLSKIIVPFFIISLIYMFYRFVNGQLIDLNFFINLFKQGSTIIYNGWFVDIIILMYIFFYLSFKFFQNKFLSIVFNTIFIICYICLAIKLGYNFWWYNSVLAFAIGLIWAKNQNKIDRFLEKYTSFTPYNYCGANPIGRIDLNGDTLSVVNKTGGFLFSLDDGTFLKSEIKASDLYKRGTQWFESTAENYMPLLSVNANIRKSESFKHFTWQDIIDFAEIDRSMLSYRSHGSGDWKAEGKPANGYLLVEIEGIPYWADAIGQIPFALNDYRNYYKNSFDSEYAERNTIADGAQFANGSLWNLIFPSYDYSNTYDNAMIKRAVDWVKHRYYKSVEHTYFLGIDFPNWVMKKNDYPANNMGVYILK